MYFLSLECSFYLYIKHVKCKTASGRFSESIPEGIVFIDIDSFVHVVASRDLAEGDCADHVHLPVILVLVSKVGRLLRLTWAT